MGSYIYSIDNPSHQQVKDIRNRCWHYISPEVASVAEIDIGTLKQFCIGVVNLEPWRLHRLALRTQIYQERKR
jgi:hypothetical protein